MSNSGEKIYVTEEKAFRKFIARLGFNIKTLFEQAGIERQTLYRLIKGIGKAHFSTLDAIERVLPGFTYDRDENGFYFFRNLVAKEYKTKDFVEVLEKFGVSVDELKKGQLVRI